MGLVAIAAVAGNVINGRAQSVDSLLDKLVDKGVLTVKEAKDLREEGDKDFSKAYAAKSGMADWVSALKFSGDFRGRYEWISPNSVAVPSNIDRQRFRYRLRFGVVASLMDDFEAGFRLTSGQAATGNTSGGDPISGNTTFSGNGSKKFVYFDQAYGKWSPLHAAGWNGNLTIGKMENPFLFSDMVFDPDYTPEGAASSISYAFNDRQSLKITGAGFLLNELPGSVHDTYLVAGQLRWDAKWTPKLQSSLGFAALTIQNGQNANTAALPNQNVGNTRLTANPDLLAYSYHPLVADAAVTYTLDSFPLYNGAFPIKAFGDYIRNPSAPTDRNTGWSAGLTLGKSGKKGLWDLTYRYKHLQSDAWFEELADSDTGAFYPTAPVGGAAGYGSGTNIKGHVIKLSYSPFDSFTLGATCFLMDLINNPSPAASSHATRLQVDANWKF